MANKNFEVKHGLSVGGTERITSAGAGTFTDLTLTGDLALTGDLNITGDVNSVSVTDLDVTDKTITLGKGQTESNSGGSGIVVDGSNASILWDESSGEWDFNNPLAVVNSIGGDTVLNLTGSYGSGNNVALLGFARAGGAVSGDIRYVDASTDMEIGTGTAHAFSLKTSGTRRVKVHSDGKVDVGGSGGLYGLLTVTQKSGADTDEGGIGIVDSSNGRSLRLYCSSTTSFINSGNGGGGNLVLNESGGKVGIGNTSPKALTHIGTLASGDGSAQEILRLSGDYTATNSGVQLYFTNQHNSGANPNAGEYYLGGIKAYDFRSDWGGALALQTAPSTSTGGTPVDRLVIDPDGKIGIGNSTPGTNHAKANNLVVGSGAAGGIAVYNGTNEGWYAFSRANANNTDAYDGGMSYDGDRNLRLHTNAGTERLKIAGDGLATFTSSRSEWAMRLNSAGGRAGIVFDKPGTTTIMGSALMLSSDETFRLGTASYYHVRMDQSGNTYFGNSSTTRFNQSGNLSVNTTSANSGITSGTDVRALGPCFANEANSFTMSQEGTGNADAYLAARGANGSTRGNIRIGVSVSGGSGFKTGVRIDNEGRTTTPENPAFRYRATAAQVLNSGWQIVGYGTLKEERGTGYSSSNSRFTAPVAGWYQFNASWSANNNADTDGTFSICRNGSYTDLVGSVSMPQTGGSYDGHSVSGCCYLDVNDYVDVRRYSTVATTTRSSAPYGGWFSGFLIG